MKDTERESTRAQCPGGNEDGLQKCVRNKIFGEMGARGAEEKEGKIRSATGQLYDGEPLLKTWQVCHQSIFRTIRVDSIPRANMQNMNLKNGKTLR